MCKKDEFSENVQTGFLKTGESGIRATEHRSELKAKPMGGTVEDRDVCCHANTHAIMQHTHEHIKRVGFAGQFHIFS